MSKELKLEEIRTRVLNDLDSMKQTSAFNTIESKKVDYLYKTIDLIQQGHYEIVDGEEVVTDRFIRFLEAIAKDPINKDFLYKLVPTTREEILTPVYPKFTMKPSSLQANSKYYGILYIPDDVMIGKLVITPKNEKHYIVDFVELRPDYQAIGYITDIIKDCLTSEFGLTSFELAHNVFGFKAPV